jgi:NifU-like protein
MSYDDLIETFTWQRTSKKAAEKIITARNVGSFEKKESQDRGMLCIKGRAGSVEAGNIMQFYWLVDPSDGVIVDAKFQAFGHWSLISAGEAACELLIGKNYDQAKRLGIELIDKNLRDKSEIAAFPIELSSYLNLIIEAIEAAAEQCLGIPLAATYVSPIPSTVTESEGYPGWLSLSHTQKLAVIEEVLNTEVRPYIELDEGGIEIQELIDDKELIIAYKGACTSCYSSIGGTLSTIQQIVQTKIHPTLIVVPNMDALQF